MEKITKDRIWFLSGIVLLIGMLLFFTRSCDNKIIAEVPQSINSSDNRELKVIKIDGCEYIRSEVYAGYSYTHKGDCNNLMHVYRGQ